VSAVDQAWADPRGLNPGERRHHAALFGDESVAADDRLGGVLSRRGGRIELLDCADIIAGFHQLDEGFDGRTAGHDAFLI
jgi:hypothetical protein